MLKNYVLAGTYRPISPKTQLNDALMAFEHHLDLVQRVIDELNRLTIRAVFVVVSVV